MCDKANLIWMPVVLIGTVLFAILWRTKTPPTLESARSHISHPSQSTVEVPISGSAERESRPLERHRADSNEAPPKDADRATGQRTGELTDEEREERYILFPGHDELISMRDWNGFYREARGANPFELTDLIIRRLGHELALTDSQCKRIQDLLKKEHDEAAKEILAKYGMNTVSGIFTIPHGRLKREAVDVTIPEGLRASAKELWDGITTTCDDVRRKFNGEYASAFDPSQMGAINDHLRNRNYTLCSGYMKRYGDDKLGVDTSQDDTIRIMGVGKVGWGYTYYSPGEVSTATIPPLK